MKCTAPRDPDSFLLSPPAPHWHSGTASERRVDERGRGGRKGEERVLIKRLKTDVAAVRGAKLGPI